MPIALVTGANGGVGRRITELLLTDGWEVYAQYRRDSVEIDAPVQPTWIQADLTQPSSTQPDLTAFPHFTSLDALVHCAGYCRLSPVAEAPAEDWERSFGINLHAPVALTTALLPALRAARGTVVYLNSGAGYHVNPTWTAYAASKFAARAWCEGLRAEEPHIRVCSIYPGRIDTPMQRAIVRQEKATYQPENYLTADSVARAAVAALQAPDDAHVTDLSLSPRPRRSIEAE